MVHPDDALLATWRERWVEPVVGWDLSGFADSVVSAAPPWSYDELVLAALAARPGPVLDLGTGGGEWLLGLAARLPGGLPPGSRATEGWPDNLPVARAALAPLGVGVEPYDADAGDRLPFPDASFAVVLSRHEAYEPGEVRRVLVPGGTFLTQQVDGRNLDDLAATFGGSAAYPDITLAPLRAQAAQAGLVVDLAEEWSGPVDVADVATLVGYLRIMPWQLPAGWSVDGHAETLLDLHRRTVAGTPLRFTERLLVLRATRPA